MSMGELTHSVLGHNAWEKAEFEDDATKNKFLRLMGGFKSKPAQTATSAEVHRKTHTKIHIFAC